MSTQQGKLEVIYQEFAHLGPPAALPGGRLYHSHSLNSRPNVDSGTCSTSEYGETLDMMGNPSNFEGGHNTPSRRNGWAS